MFASCQVSEQGLWHAGVDTHAATFVHFELKLGLTCGEHGLWFKMQDAHAQLCFADTYVASSASSALHTPDVQEHVTNARQTAIQAVQAIKGTAPGPYDYLPFILLLHELLSTPHIYFLCRSMSPTRSRQPHRQCRPSRALVHPA